MLLLPVMTVYLTLFFSFRKFEYDPFKHSEYEERMAVIKAFVVEFPKIDVQKVKPVIEKKFIENPDDLSIENKNPAASVKFAKSVFEFSWQVQ